MSALLGGCATSASVQHGALIGALSGAAAGTAVGVLVTDEDLLGSATDPRSGDVSLPRGESIAAAAAIGTVLGAVVGAMVGHHREQKYVRPGVPEAPPPSSDSESAAVGPVLTEDRILGRHAL